MIQPDLLLFELYLYLIWLKGHISYHTKTIQYEDILTTPTKHDDMHIVVNGEHCENSFYTFDHKNGKHKDIPKRSMRFIILLTKYRLKRSNNIKQNFVMSNGSPALEFHLTLHWLPANELCGQ